MTSNTENHNHSFGFKNVSAQEKTSLVESVFTNVASKYDLMNDVMSGGLHRLWKDELVKLLRPRPDLVHLDMAGGTGDIAFRSLKACNRFPDASPEITICDQNACMLQEGKKRALDQGITRGLNWVQADAAKTPFKDDTFDVYTISFGLRNVTEIQTALDESWRVLKPGGHFFCMEFSPIENNSFFSKVYKEYAFHIIPRIGSLIAGDRASYQYLVESIERFPNKETLRANIQKSGYENVTYQSLTGGLVAIHSAVKPLKANRTI